MITLPTPPEMQERVRAMMEAHWRAPGFTVPNPVSYPAQYLWDSCFHAVIWTALGRADRALAELANVFAHQADDGFVPHMTYWDDPDRHADFWGRRHTSSITQPPMVGHAIAEVARRGTAVDDELIGRAEAALRFLVERRRRGDRVVIVHPWESGCDDSPRWDSWCPPPWSAARWKEVKGALVASLRHDDATGSAIGNPAFEVDAASFNALLAFNIDELASVTTRPLDPALSSYRDRYAPSTDDAMSDHVARPSSGVATSEALLPVLVDPDSADVVLDRLADPAAFGGDCGPTTVHRAEPAFDPAAYWRGPAWPQLTYLFWVAALRAGRAAAASGLADRLVAGAARSGLAEYWDPDDGTAHGARPQSWAGLAAVVSDR